MKKRVIIEMQSADNILLLCEPRTAEIYWLNETGQERCFHVQIGELITDFDTLAEALEFAYAEVQK